MDHARRLDLPLRLLVVSDVSPYRMEGGAERLLWEETRRLAQRGHRVRIACRAPAPDAPRNLRKDGVDIHHFFCDQRSSSRFLFSAIREAGRLVTQLLAEEECDTLNIHQPLSGYGAIRALRGSARPQLYTFLSPAPIEYFSRTGMSPHHRRGPIGRSAQVLLFFLERHCLRRADFVRVLSDFSARQLWKLYELASERVIKIPGGADLDRFRPALDRQKVRAALGIPADRPLLLTVRNLEARMGLGMLIRTIAIIRHRFPQLLLLIGGTGPLRENLESLAISLGLQDNVHFLGYIPEADLAHYYQAADLFILPSRALEGFGLTTVEALACGAPVMGTPIGATPEILQPLDTGLLFREATPESMADGITHFLNRTWPTPNGSTAFRHVCNQYAREHYDWEQVVERVDKTLTDLRVPLAHNTCPTSPCPACGNTHYESDLVYLGTKYVRCAACRTGRVAALPPIHTLRRYYEVDYPWHYKHELVGDARASLFEAILGRIREVAPARLLDIGCGGGHLLAAATLHGYRGVGVDLSYEACAIARHRSISALQADGAILPFRSRSLNIVTLINVLDHLLDPLATLQEVSRVLAPGGYLVIRIPNAAFHRSCIRALRCLGPLIRWRGWDQYPILHLFAFTRAGLLHTVSRAGLRVLSVRNSPAAADGLGSLGTSVGLRKVFTLISSTARILEIASRGQWLLGPSIELYAQQPADGIGGSGPLICAPELSETQSAI